MFDPISQRLMPRERIKWRQVPNDDSFQIAWGPALIGAMAGAAMDPTESASTLFLLIFLVLMTGRVLLEKRTSRFTTAALTNERFIIARYIPDEDPEDALQFNSYALRWIQGIDILPGALRLRLADGRVKVIAPLNDATKVGLTIAEAAGLERPWIPSLRERFAQEFAVLACFAVAAMAYAVTFQGIAPEVAEVSKLEALGLKLPPAIIAAFLGGVLGLLAAITVLKSYLSLAEMRAWMRQSGFFAPGPEPGAKTHVFARFCLSYVDQLYENTGSPAPEEPGER